jgi:hypothetical protein
MDIHAYRPSDELAAALLGHMSADEEFVTQVKAWDAEHPGTELMWSTHGFSTDRSPVGFADGHTAVPDGLSRAKTRTTLRPVRGAAGRPWRDLLARFDKKPRVEPIWRQFDVPAHGDGFGNGRGGFYIAATHFVDAGEDGVIVFCKYDLTRRSGYDEPRTLSPHLTPIPLSEFYRIKERLDAERSVEVGA